VLLFAHIRPNRFRLQNVGNFFGPISGNMTCWTY